MPTIADLKKVCDQSFLMDSQGVGSVIRACRDLASRLRHEQDYEEAKKYYERAIDYLRIEAKKTPTDLDNQICLLETKIDLGSTLFDQELYTACFSQLEEIGREIQPMSQDHELHKEMVVCLRKFFLLNARAHFELKSVDKANQFLEKYEGLSSVNTTESDEVFQTLKANLCAQEGKHTEALERYYKAMKCSHNALREKQSRSGCIRFFACAINLARAHEKNKNYENAIKPLNEAIKTSEKLNRYIGNNDSWICRLHLEIARLFEHRNELDKAIKHVEEVNSVHKTIIELEQFHPFDLLYTLSMVKRLAHWYARKGDLLKAGNSFIDMAKVLKTKYPYQQLYCLNQALFYFQAIYDDVKTELLAKTLSHLAQAYRDLPCPDYMNALRMIKNAISLSKTDERVNLKEGIKAAYKECFRGWPAAWVIQWSFCLYNLSDFQQNCFNSSLHRDDFFHWQTLPLTLPPERRVQLMMLLSRLYCLLDQSYNEFVKKTMSIPKNMGNFYFPVELSEHALKKKWETAQKVWEENVSNKEGKLEKVGFSQPQFQKVRAAITHLQPFISKDSWLFELSVSYNYSKHVHIGLQQLPLQYLEKRSGLIKHSFTDIQIGFTRINPEVYPLSFNRLLNNQAMSKEVYQLLLDGGILEVKDSLDKGIARIKEITQVSSYMEAMENKAGAQQSAEALCQYTQLILEKLSRTALNKEHAQKIAGFLLNLVGQTKGFEETEDRTDATPFVQRSFKGVAELLTTFNVNQAEIRGEDLSATPSVEEFTELDTIKGSACDVFGLANEYTNSFAILQQYKHDTRLEDTRSYYQAAAGLFSFFLAHQCIESIQKLLEEVSSVLPRCFVKHYLDQLKQWQPGAVAWIEAYSNIVEIPVFPTGTDTGCIDDDLLERIKNIHQSLYYDLPVYLFLQNNHAKMMRINMSVDFYLQIIFILDQIFKRYLSRVLGQVTSIAFPGNKGSLSGIKKYSLDSSLLAKIKESFSWLPGFRQIALRAKHSNIEDVSGLASSGFSNKSFKLNHLDLERAGYLDEKSNSKPVQLLKELKRALDFSRSVVLIISELMTKLPQKPILYNHLKVLAQAGEPASKDFSVAAVQQSARRSSVLAHSSFRSSEFNDEGSARPQSQSGGGSKDSASVRDVRNDRSDMEANSAALQTQREINKVQLTSEMTETSITVEVTPDGDCGFRATQYALNIAGMPDVAAKVSREGFITSVKEEIKTFADQADIDSKAELLNLLINIMKNNEARRASASKIESASAQDKLSWLQKNVDAWSSDFTEWATDLHFEWMACLHDISFKVFIVDHADNIRFVPRPDGIMGIERAERPVIHLLHNSHTLVNPSHAGDPNTHFDLLCIAPTEEKIRHIHSLGLTITQDKAAEPACRASSGGMFSRHGLQQEKIVVGDSGSEWGQLHAVK